MREDSGLEINGRPQHERGYFKPWGWMRPPEYNQGRKEAKAERGDGTSKEATHEEENPKHPASWKRARPAVQAAR